MIELTFRQIEVLHALLSARGLTAGASRLSIPQSNASAILAKARRSFGDPLLVRGKSGMSLTEEGARILEATRRVIASVASLNADPSSYDPIKDDGHFRIAAVDYVQAAVLPHAVAAVRALAPRLQIALLPLDRLRLRQSMEDDEIDLAVTTAGHAPTGLRIARLLPERFVCVARKGDIEADGLDLDIYCRLPHILTSPTHANFTGEVDDVLASQGRSRIVASSTSSFFAALALLRETGGIVTVPSRVTASIGSEFEIFEPPLPVRGFELVLCWHPRLQSSLRHSSLRDAVLGSLRAFK